ncbi:MAG: FtsW/RodA/SpoVE family cell cycle protein, partial [Proteobacteria bacterium]|nr:FtsW/RodA/SpoVE family cell cycle protein [Pseudomonadota bacterium]
MRTLTRTDNSILGRWWWTVDHWSLAAVGLLIAFGAVMILAASPAVAERIDVGTYHFVKRQFAFLLLASVIIVGISMLSPKVVRRLGVLVLAGALVLMAVTLVAGHEIKGANRWLSLGGFSLQPSEFAKPGLAVVAAWLFANRRIDESFPGFQISVAVYLVTVALLLMQPDIGMTFVVSVVWGTQFFVAGLPLLLVGVIGGIFLTGGVGAYFAFSHVRLRVDRFLDPKGEEGYQVSRAIEAFQKG